MKKIGLILLILMLALGVVLAQRGFRGGFGGRFGSGDMIRTEGGVWVDQTRVRTAREIASHSTGTPNWTNAPGLRRTFSPSCGSFVTGIRMVRPHLEAGSRIFLTAT